MNWFETATLFLMTYDTIEVPFTNELRIWLITIGYTHILNKGLAGVSPAEENENAPYELIPLRPLDPPFKVASNKDRIERITSNDVIDMANGDPFIRFVASLPIDEFNEYLKI